MIETDIGHAPIEDPDDGNLSGAQPCGRGGVHNSDGQIGDETPDGCEADDDGDDDDDEWEEKDWAVTEDWPAVG